MNKMSLTNFSIPKKNLINNITKIEIYVSSNYRIILEVQNRQSQTNSNLSHSEQQWNH